MNQNSNAWWGASDEEKKRLEEENKYLSGLLNQNGGNVSFDPVTGTWSGSAGGLTTPQLPQVEDYSNYLEEMYAAQIMRIYRGDTEPLTLSLEVLPAKGFQMQIGRKTMQSARIICW